ncbi:MAG: hypothetical protein HY314_04175 [Acidobacteria bacterium]|nr:hypothetical protein [Acidobacteriota bacterium]
MMSRQIAILAVIALMLSNTTTAVLATNGEPTATKTISTSVPIMPLSEVKPGMRGTIKTVFRGSQIEEFGFEVLGILDNVLGPKQNIILVRLIGEKPEFTGVVAGMSGSPAYIDSRLVGALSLRIGVFAKEPIAGITPIESMLPLFDINATTPRKQLASWMPRTVNKPTGGPTDRQNEVASLATSNPSNWLRLLEPIPTPLFFTGFSQEVIDPFAPIFQRQHLIPMLAGGGSAASLEFKPEAAADFVPGAPVSAVLVAGDLGVYATGTLSYRDGDRILAFGHPFFQLGGVDLPMARSTILTTLASQEASFKISRLEETIGSVSQDRLTAIMGVIGVKPAMIPVSIRVHTPARGVIPYRYEIFRHPALTPLLFNITLFASVLQSLEQADQITLDYAGTIHIEGHPDLKFKDVITSTDRSFFQPVALVASGQINSLFTRLYGNGYETPKITGVEVDFKVTEDRRVATLEELRVAKQEVRPGEEVDVYAILKPYRGEAIIKSFKVRIPNTVNRGDQLRLLVGDAATLRSIEQRGIGDDASSLDNLIDILSRERTNDRVYLRVSEQAPGYYIDDRLLPSLPLSVISVIESGRTANQATKVGEAPLLVESAEVGYVVNGRRELTLTVK